MPAPKKSLRPKARDESSAPTRSLRPKARKEEMIGGGMREGTRGIDPMENYSPEDFETLTGGKSTKNFRDGGSVGGCKSIQSSGKGFAGTY